jgi:hypothetical protein
MAPPGYPTVKYVSTYQLKSLLDQMHTNVFDFLSQHHLMENLSSSHANKGMVQFLGFVGPQWLGLISARVISIESWTGYWSFCSGGSGGALGSF